MPLTSTPTLHPPFEKSGYGPVLLSVFAQLRILGGPAFKVSRPVRMLWKDVVCTCLAERGIPWICHLQHSHAALLAH